MLYIQKHIRDFFVFGDIAQKWLIPFCVNLLGAMTESLRRLIQSILFLDENNIDWAAPPFRAREAFLAMGAFLLSVYLSVMHRLQG